VLRHQVVGHGLKASEALDGIVKDQRLPQGLAGSGAEKGVMPVLGNIHPDHQHCIRAADSPPQLVEGSQPVLMGHHKHLSFCLGMVPLLAGKATKNRLQSYCSSL
jgi:hypothetical protein